MKKKMAMLWALFMLFESNAMMQDDGHGRKAAIHQIDIKDPRYGIKTLLVVDLPTKEPTRVFLFNGLLSTDLVNFSTCFQLGFGYFKIEAFPANARVSYKERVVEYHEPKSRYTCVEPKNGFLVGISHGEPLYFDTSPPSEEIKKVLCGPRIEIETTIKSSFGLDSVDYSYRLVASPNDKYIDWERHINLGEINRSFFLATRYNDLNQRPSLGEFLTKDGASVKRKQALRHWRRLMAKPTLHKHAMYHPESRRRRLFFPRSRSREDVREKLMPQNQKALSNSF